MTEHHTHQGHEHAHDEDGSHTVAADGHSADHVHGADCGHDAVPHGDHTDYLVEGHLHHPHGDHCDNHGELPLA